MSNPPIAEKRIWRFGLYELDVTTGRLSKQGNLIKLQDQPFRILSMLLEKAGEMVSREELCNELWPDGTFVEFDGSLNTALMKLRAALNDDPDNPRFIETVPRKGYRFIAPVSVVESKEPGGLRTPEMAPSVLTPENGRPDAQPPWPRTETPAANPVSRKPWAWIAVLGVAILAAATLWRIWPRSEPRVTLVTQLTHTGKVVPGSKIVTDGTRIYFVAEQDGRLQLMQSSIRGGSAEKLSTPFDNTVVLDISPDHLQFLVGQFAHAGEAMPVWVWPAHGGAPHRLGDVSAQEAAWSPAGNLIAFSRDYRLFVVKADGTGVQTIGTFTSTPHALVWSPDGKRLRFTKTDLAEGSDEIWEVSAEGRELRQLFVNKRQEMHESSGAWAQLGRYFLFTAGSDSHLNLAVDTLSNIWAVPDRGGLFRAGSRSPVEMTHGPVSYTELAALPAGSRVFALGTHPQYQLFRFDARTGKSIRILEDAGATQVDYSPDGEWIVYALRQNGTLWKSRKDGSGRLELTSVSPGAYAPSWSPNGKEILFTAFLLGKQPQLYVVPSSGGVPRPLLSAGTPGRTLSGDWSPDSSHIIMDYTENLENSRSQLQILNVATGAITKLPGTEGLTQPRWSPDGAHLAAIEGRTHRILVSDAEGRVWSFLADALSPSGIYWSADGKSLYFQDSGDAEKSVYRVRMGEHTKEKVLGFGPWLTTGAAECHFTGVGPDGSIYATIDHGGTDLYALDLNLP
jgi:Tol biopolymer transport system component/DNA-binding winged helix-turn-helix (wHTH) protein